MTALPSGKSSKVARIVTFDGDLDSARAGQAITLTLEDEIDISRGDLLVPTGASIKATNQFLADVVWMTDQPLVTGRQYDIKIAGKQTVGQLESIKYQYDINNLEQFETKELPLNGIGLCEISLTETVALDEYSDCEDTGGFIFIDRLTNVTGGAGMIRERLLSQDLQPQTSASFEVELNALIRKHFPHWEAKDISQIFDVKPVNQQ